MTKALADPDTSREPSVGEGRSPSASADDDEPAISRSTGRRWLAWMVAMVAFLLPLAAWSLATPSYGSPDEPAHAYRAAAVVRGEIVPPGQSAGLGGAGLLMVPSGIVQGAEQVSCFAFKPGQAADCASTGSSDSTLVERSSSAAWSNPAYYLMVGWPSLFLPGDSGLMGMRLVGALLCAALLGSAALSLAHGRGGRLLLIGLTVAVTPMVSFLGGVVGPSGVEIAAAISAWAALLRLCGGHAGETGRLLRRFGVAASIMVLCGTLSPLWLLLILVTCLAVSSKDAVVPVLKRADASVWTGLVVLSTAASVGWTAFASGGRIAEVSDDPDRTFFDAASYALRFLGQRLHEFVGVFGWTDTPTPALGVAVFAAVLGSLVVLALATARARMTMVLGLLLVVVIVGPLALEASTFDQLGLYWQSRYALPLAVGVPLLAAYAVNDRLGRPLDRLGRRPLGFIALAVALVHGAAFLQALIRNQSGLGMTLDPLAGSWHPLVGSLTVLILQLVGLLAVAGLVLLLPVGASQRPEDTELSGEDRWFADPGKGSGAAPGAQQRSTYSESAYVDHEYSDIDDEDPDATQPADLVASSGRLERAATAGR